MEFFVSLIDGALADADEEFEAALAAQRSDESNALGDEAEPDKSMVNAEITENAERTEASEEVPPSEDSADPDA